MYLLKHEICFSVTLRHFICQKKLKQLFKSIIFGYEETVSHVSANIESYKRQFQIDDKCLLVCGHFQNCNRFTKTKKTDIATPINFRSMYLISIDGKITKDLCKNRGSRTYSYSIVFFSCCHRLLSL